MIDKAWCSIEEVPYCFPRSSIKFQGHKGQKIDDLDKIWARLLGRFAYVEIYTDNCVMLSMLTYANLC